MGDMFSRTKSLGAKLLWNHVGLRLAVQRRRRFKWPGEDNRFDYQKRYVNFDLQPGDHVLDIGSGGDPFPYATVLTDRFLEKSPSRCEPLVRDTRPFLVADIHELPFRDKGFDFVYCAHVLEVVDNPLRACAELMRVGKRGFIETPTAGKDMLFAWARNVQKWHVVAIGSHLCFFEYADRQLDGIRSPLWRDHIRSEWCHPLQEVFYGNQDVFNVLFTWEHQFSVFLFRLDGTVQALHADVEASSVVENDTKRLSPLV
jgi:methyltransferase family protein